MINAKPHPNGGGLVSCDASVHVSAYVGPHAQVQDTATVAQGCRVEDYASVSGNAVLMPYVILKDQCNITGNAVVDEGTVLTGNTFRCGKERYKEEEPIVVARVAPPCDLPKIKDDYSIWKKEQDMTMSTYWTLLLLFACISALAATFME